MLINNSLPPIHPGDDTGAIAIMAIGVVMNLQCVAPCLHMALARAPVGAWVVTVVDGADTGVIEADIEAPLRAQPGNALGCGQVPKGLVSHAGLHGAGTFDSHRIATGARPAHPLGVRMARQHKDGHGVAWPPLAQPILLHCEP